MRRVFIQFYLTLAIFCLVVLLSAGLLYKRAIDRINEDYLDDLFSTILVLIEEDLQPQSQTDWPNVIDRFQLKTDFNLSIAPLNNYDIDARSLARLKNGDILELEADNTYLELIQNSDYVLVIGPISYRYYLKHVRWIELTLLLLVVLSLALPVYVWMRPHWRDLMKIERAAKKVGQAHIGTRVQLSERSSVYSIGQAFDAMTDNIGTLMARQESLIHDIAHEIRTPLARLRYRLALLSDQTAETALSQDIGQIDELIDELLFKAKIDTARQTGLTVTPFNVRQWLDNVINQAKVGAPPEISWRIHNDLNTDTLYGDATLLKRALDNLLSNAKRFAHKHIDITLHGDDNTIRLAVADDGIGIPKEQAQHVFQAFYRLDQSRSRDTGGHGLGLAIVESIARLHHGYTSVDTGEYGGARFCLHLPIVKPSTVIAEQIP